MGNKNEGLIFDIRVVHLPEKRGDQPDYWVAIYQGRISGGASKKEAVQNLLNTLRELH
ncbi:hypothetical protein [Aeromonas jandaei]|uniref:hypothetical protein n=1 Tax=Aeromonas jandaei TaxID=650 RepID=UPI003BA265C5